MKSRELLIETFNNEIRVAVLECNILVDLIVERENRSSVVGDIYMGRVEKILPSIGARRHASRASPATCYPVGRHRRHWFRKSMRAHLV